MVLLVERIRPSKIAANRAKDKLTISVLRDALAAKGSVKRRAKKKKKRTRQRDCLADPERVQGWPQTELDELEKERVEEPRGRLRH